MDDAAKFIRIFGDHQGRATQSGQLHIRDANVIADLKARVSGLAARDNRDRDGGWLIDFTPVRTDDLTERSFFDVILTSAARGERRLSLRIGRDWVEMGDGAMESSVRGDARNIEGALESAFRRVVLRRLPGSPDPAEATMAGAQEAPPPMGRSALRSDLSDVV